MTTTLPRAVSLPFGVDSLGRIAFTTDPLKQVADRVRAIIMTNLFERVVFGRFGTDTIAYLFGANDPVTVAILQTEIATAIPQWEGGVVVTDVTVTPNPQTGVLLVNISYTTSNTTVDNTVHQAIIEIGGTVVPTNV